MSPGRRDAVVTAGASAPRKRGASGPRSPAGTDGAPVAVCPGTATAGSARAATSSGVGVLDKCVELLWAVHDGASSVALASERTGFSRPTAHRLIAALVTHGLLQHGRGGALEIGAAARELAAAGAVEALAACAPPVLTELSAATRESAQLFRRIGAVRVCIATAEPTAGLKHTAPVGTELPLTAGSAAKVLVAWGGDDLATEFAPGELAQVRARGYAVSVGEREPGLASVSAPVHYRGGVIGAVCVAGSVARLGDDLAVRLAPRVVAAATRLSNRVEALTGCVES